MVDFKKCTKEDFKRQGYSREIDIGVDHLLYFAQTPKNSQTTTNSKICIRITDMNERVSMSIDIITCNKEFVPNCKNETEIKEILSLLYFTQYNIAEAVDFKNAQNFG